MARRRDDSILLTSALLGAITGIRSMAGPAALTHSIPADGEIQPDGLNRFLASEKAEMLLSVFATGEALADKFLPLPDRTSALPLAGRAVIGSLTAAAFAAHRGRSILLPAGIGAAAAILSTFAAVRLRKAAAEEWNVPDRLIGLVEDACVVGVGRVIRG